MGYLVKLILGIGCCFIGNNVAHAILSSSKVSFINNINKYVKPIFTFNFSTTAT